jgi:hypothetical protein
LHLSRLSSERQSLFPQIPARNGFGAVVSENLLIALLMDGPPAKYALGCAPDRPVACCTEIQIYLEVDGS